MYFLVYGEYENVFTALPDLDAFFFDGLFLPLLAIFVVWTVAVILRWLAEHFWQKLLGSPEGFVGEFFVDLEWTIFWLCPFWYLTTAVIGFSRGWLLPAALTEAMAVTLALLNGAVLAFIVAKLLRRATEPE